MPSPNEIPAPQLTRLIGTPDAPVLVDARSDEDPEADPRLSPAAFRRPFERIEDLAPKLSGRRAVLICHRGGADANRPELAPQATGLSSMFMADLAPLEARMSLYDAVYRWARDGFDEGRDWPTPGGKG